MDAACVGAVDLGQRAAQAVGMFGDADQVNMVGHRHPAPHRHPVRGAVPGEHTEMERMVGVLKICPLAPVAALGDMVRDAGKDRVGKAGDLLRLAPGRQRVILGVYGRVTPTPVWPLPPTQVAAPGKAGFAGVIGITDRPTRKPQSDRGAAARPPCAR